MKDQITMTFLGVMDEIMSILKAEEVVTSSSTWWLKRRRHYVNYDREAAHFRLRHDYFNDDCVYHRHTFTGGIVRMTLFLSIMHMLSETSPYFSERYDTTGHIGLITLQKCTVVVH
jgi:hypothetical protein